jgi:hypothetical protein
MGSGHCPLPMPALSNGQDEKYLIKAIVRVHVPIYLLLDKHVHFTQNQYLRNLNLCSLAFAAVKCYS